MKTEGLAEQDPSMGSFAEESVSGSPPPAGVHKLPRPYRPEGKANTHYPKDLKLHVTLEALRERLPQGELGAIYGIPQSLISIWKKAAVEAIRSNIHYKHRKRREALGLVADSASEEALSAAPADAVQHLCRILRDAARQIERDPAVLEKLVKQGLTD